VKQNFCNVHGRERRQKRKEESKEINTFNQVHISKANPGYAKYNDSDK
jgi:hypothetical protein